MSKQISISNNLIPTLPEGSYRDAAQRGLILRVTKASRTFQFYGYLHGKPVKRSLGKWPDMQLKVARLAVQAIWLEPAPEKNAAPTLGELAEMYSLKCETEGNKTDHMGQSYRLNWTCYADTQLDDITAIELQRKHNAIAKERGPAAARRAIRAMRILFNYAIKKELTGRNPAAGVDTAPTVRRSVFLNEAELQVFHSCLEGMGREPRDFFKLALLTGMRKSNILGMRKDWVDFGDGCDHIQGCAVLGAAGRNVGATVTVPAEESKNGKEMILCLVPAAVEIIRGRMPGDNLYVFPGRVSGHAADAASWLKDLRRRMRENGVSKHFTIHDLRRTMATRLNAAGVPLPTIAMALGHETVDSTPIYARSDLGMVRAALSRV